MDFRKARTRTLIQLGGLIEKSGILHSLDLNLGDDLQKDPTCFETVSTLMGALLEINSSLNDDYSESQKLLWSEKGKEKLSTQ